MKLFCLLLLQISLVITSARYLTTEEKYETTEEISSTWEPVTDIPKPTPLPTPEILINGYVYKDYHPTTFQKECPTPFAASCSEFTRTLCTTMNMSLAEVPELGDIFYNCGIQGPDKDKVISSITLPPGHSRHVDLTKVRHALVECFRFARKGWSYYGSQFTVTGVGIIDTPITEQPSIVTTEEPVFTTEITEEPIQTTEEISSTWEPVTDLPKPTPLPTPEIVVDGYVYKDYLPTTFYKECPSPHAASCSYCTKTLCETMNKSIAQVPELGDIFYTCGIQGPDKDKIITSITLPPGHSRHVDLTRVRHALVECFAFAQKGWCYYGSQFTVYGVGIIDTPITEKPRPTTEPEYTTYETSTSV